MTVNSDSYPNHNYKIRISLLIFTIMIGWIIALVIWVVGIFVAYNKFIKYWENQSKFERVYFAIIWPLVLPLYIIHWIHNKL